MEAIKYFILYATILSAITCSNTNNCNADIFEKVEKLYSIPLDNNGKLSYQHLILIEKLERRCLDSSITLRAIDAYIEGMNDEKPVASIEIFNSKEGFDIGETLSQPKEIYKNCLVTIWFDPNTGKAYKYLFYDRDGDVAYEGPLWKPK